AAGAGDAPIGCIKLDVEGHEMQALKGMADIIARDRPSLIVEIWPHERDELMAFFQAHDYRREQLQGMNWLFTPNQRV
ncbi:MAG: FkbM family methyltransferase, partial [Pseudomonadota bacterium]